VRLIQLAAYDGPYPGSSIPMIRAALLEAGRRGWHAEAVFAETARGRDWLGLFAEDGIPARIVPRGSRRAMAGDLRSLMDERPGEPTVLHTHFTAYDVPAVMAARGRPDTSVIWHLHTPPDESLRGRLRNRAKFSLYGRNVDRVLCVAPHLAERVSAMVDDGRAIFFPNGIDTARFHRATPDERRRARAELGVTSEGPLLGHLAWDWQVKGGDILLEALRRGVPVVASDIPGHALIAGEYPGCRLVPGTPDGIAAGVAGLLDQPADLLASETTEAARRIAAQMGLEAWTRRLFEQYP
jgi:glycosyltransferase involved in cell wall biosynthesis